MVSVSQRSGLFARAPIVVDHALQVIHRIQIDILELAGGPTQFETYDPKPDAPSEIRGPFGVVETSVPGVRFCELMAEQANHRCHTLSW